MPLLLIEQAFFTANMLKVLEGAWVPLLMAACVGLVMVTWVRGSRLLILHERNIIMSIRTEDTPRVPRHERISVERVTDTFIRVIARYGFMETPSVPKILEQCRRKDSNFDIGATSFCRGAICAPRRSRTCRPGRITCSSRWRAARRMPRPTSRSPTDRVVEVGTQVRA